MKKKALAVLWVPKALLDFLWYYEAYGKEKYEYDLIVMSAGVDEDGKWKEEIYDNAVKSGIFQKITVCGATYIDQSGIKKAKILAEMFWFALRRKQALYCASVMKPWFDYRDYEQIVTVFYPRIFSGELLVLSEYLEVVLLEDGMRDYLPHHSWPTREWIMKGEMQYEMAGCILSKLGYADPTTMYTFKPTKKCIKFSSDPGKLLYRDYKIINKLNDMSLVEQQSYQNLVKKTFQIDVTQCKADIVLFTAPLYDFSEKIESELVKKTVRFIEEKYHPTSIIIKKHPRDKCKYEFKDEIRIIEIDSNIPAELVVGTVEAKKHIFMYTTALLMSYPSYNNCVVLRYDELFEGSAYYRKCYEADCERMNIPSDIITSCD